MNTRTIKTSWRKVVALTIAASAALPMVANAASQIVTNTIDGVTCSPASTLKWQIVIDPDATTKTAQLGLNSNGDKVALPFGTPDGKVVVPRKFTVDDVDYAVTEVYQRAFMSASGIQDVTILENVDTVSWRSFYGTALRNLLIKGPVSGSKTVGFGHSGDWFPFENCKKIKLVIVGPNVATGSSRQYFKFPSSTGVTALVPYRSGYTSWNGVTDASISPSSNPTANKVVRYGPSYDFDMKMGETEMTFYPKNENGTTNVLAWATTIKSAFDMDTKVVLENNVEMKMKTSSIVAVTLNDTATLKVAQSGTVTLGGNLTLAETAALAFNFTDKATAPTLAIPVASTIPETVNVKISANEGVRPSSSQTYTLTSTFDFTGKAVNLVDKPDWVKSVDIVDGNLVLTVKSKGFTLIVY